MLKRNELMKKINKAPAIFNKLMNKGEYCAAKWLFYNTMATAVFAELDEENMERLFGENGEFKPEQVKTAFRKAGGGIGRTGLEIKVQTTGGIV